MRVRLTAVADIFPLSPIFDDIEKYTRASDRRIGNRRKVHG